MGTAKNDLHLKSFRRVPAQIINDDTRNKRLERRTALTEHSYNETSLLHRRDLPPKAACRPR